MCFSLDTLFSSTNITDGHDLSKINCISCVMVSILTSITVDRRFEIDFVASPLSMQH